MWSFRRGLATAAAGGLRLPKLIYSSHPSTAYWPQLAESRREKNFNYWKLIEDPELSRLIKLYDANCRCRKERKTSVGNFKKDHKKSRLDWRNKTILSKFQYHNSIEETEKISSNKSKPQHHNIIEDVPSSPGFTKSPSLSLRNTLNKSKLDIIKDISNSEPTPSPRYSVPIEEIIYPVSSSSSSDINNPTKYKPEIIRETSSGHNKTPSKRINLSKFKMYSIEEITPNVSKHRHHNIKEEISHSRSKKSSKLKKLKEEGSIEETNSPQFKESSTAKRKNYKRKSKRDPIEERRYPESRKSLSSRKNENELREDPIEETSPEGNVSANSSSNRKSESKLKQDLNQETSSGGNKLNQDPIEKTSTEGGQVQNGSKKASSNRKKENKLKLDLNEKTSPKGDGSGKSSSNRKKEIKLKKGPIENTSSLEFKKLSSAERRYSERKSLSKAIISPDSPDLGVYLQYKRVNFSSENIRRMSSCKSKRKRSTFASNSRKSKDFNSSRNDLLTIDSTASPDKRSSKDRKTRKSVKRTSRLSISPDRKVKFKDSRSILSRNSSHQKARRESDEPKPPKVKPGNAIEVIPTPQKSLRTILSIDHYLSQNPMSGSSLHEAFSNFNFEPIDLVQHKKDFLASLSENPIEIRNSWPKIWPKVLEQRKVKSENPLPKASSMIKKRFKRRFRTVTHFLPIPCKYHIFNAKNFKICGEAVEKDKTVACQTQDLPEGSDLCNLCDPSNQKEEPLPVDIKQRLDRDILHRYYQQMCQRESNSKEKPLKTKDKCKLPQRSNAAWHCSTWGKMRRQLEICQAAIDLCSQVIEAQHRLRRIKRQSTSCRSVPSYEKVMRFIRAKSRDA